MGETHYCDSNIAAPIFEETTGSPRNVDLFESASHRSPQKNDICNRKTPIITQA